MTRSPLFERLAPDRTARAGVIGAGHFASAIVTQSRAIPRLEVPVVADLNPAAARRAFQLAGFAADQVAACDTLGAAQTAMARGCPVLLTDPMLMMGLPLDVIVEATGDADAGAQHALAAIQHGKHVAMVNKETDVIVGPILKHLADQAGVVYTAVDGDQHGLLIQLVAWARELGLEVLCGGKARHSFVLFQEAARSVAFEAQRQRLDDDQARCFGPIPAGQTMEFVAARSAILDVASNVEAAVIELVIAANATGLTPDGETLHHPILRTVEIPEALCPQHEGGILRHSGAIEEVIGLCHPHEAHLGGGVFTVVGCANDYSRHILTTKGLLANQRGTAALIYQPYHLCGVETATSILSAALLHLPTGASDYQHRFDVIARTTHDIQAGQILSRDETHPLIRPAQPVVDHNPLPLGMACGRVASSDIPAGTVITADMVARPSTSVLWSLRRDQDARFLGQS